MSIPINENELILRKILKKDSDIIDLFGASVALLYSKQAFEKNQDISYFLTEVFGIDFLPYVMRSRTLIVARITKEIKYKNSEELEVIKGRIIEYLNKNNTETTLDNISSVKKKPKKKDANDKMKTWLEGL
ncbi:hypothetical protein J2T13_003686 [Paenibacillus sp. DS2015]|uniref:hypothetical protein n=1 Tax=Paenibacillus sp. DS2015 TaxID=3373917 RepID=UPI003D199483